MPRIKAEHEVCRSGERYLNEVAGPAIVGRYTHSDELWIYYRGTVQGRPCDIRMAAIPDDFLCEGRRGKGYRHTWIALVQERVSRQAA